MNRVFTILVICGICSINIYSQQQVIPEVKAHIWYDSEKQQENISVPHMEKVAMKSSPKMGSTLQEDSLRLLNFHKVKTFEQEKVSIKTPYDVKGFSRLTVIVVYHSSDTVKEHGIWSVYSGESQVSGLTDRRLFRQKSEYVYPVKRRGIPLINTSMQSFSKSRAKTDSNYFVLGETMLPDTSISYYSGDIAECLVFDRFLKKTEALKIETYLAIKYGITLIASDYLSSSERILWNYEENKDYSNGIAGLGKDSILELNQLQGSSSEEEGLLTIGTGIFREINKENTFNLLEGNYLLWGHNEGNMSSENSCEEEYPLWERKWLMQVSYTDTAKRFGTTVKVRLPEEYRDTTRLNYLVIDRSGEGDFTALSVEYIPQNRYDTGGYVYFTGVIWDTDGSGKDMFGFSYGAILDTGIKASCEQGNSGLLSVSICGGKTPISYLLQQDNVKQTYTYQGGREYTFEGLSTGTYTLTVTDSYEKEITQRITIPSLPLNEFELPSKYWLNTQSKTVINAKEYNSTNFASYVWEKDNTFFSDSAEANISLPGKYKLTVTDSNGCVYMSEMEVEELTISSGKLKQKSLSKEQEGTGLSKEGLSFYYKLYPNPTTGNYKVEVDLPEETAVFIRVFTVKGDLLEEWQERGKKYYLFESYLDMRGNYIIEVETSFGIEDFKLTVVK